MSTTRSPGVGEVVAGLSLGSLLGLLVGMSTTPVVSLIVTALTGTLAGFLGLTAPAAGADDSLLGRLGRGAPAPGRLIAFSAGFIVLMLGGMWMRTHDFLSPSPAYRVERWKAAGLDERDARALAAVETVGGTYSILVPSPTDQVEGLVAAGVDRSRALELVTGGAGPAAAGAVTARPATSTALFHEEKEVAFCARLRSDALAPEEEVKAWQQQGGQWALAARNLERRSEQSNSTSVMAVRDALCP